GTRDILAYVQQDWIREPQGPCHLGRTIGVFVDVDAEQHEPGAAIPGVDLVQQQHLLPTRAAPCCPEIENDHLTELLGKSDVLSIERAQHKIRSRLADEVRRRRQRKRHCEEVREQKACVQQSSRLEI